MKILIPSYNRARCVFALEIFPTATVIVPASQEAEYRRCNPGATVEAIPDAQDGNLSRKRNLLTGMAGKEADGAFVAVDDDVCGLWDKQEGRAVSGPDAVAVLEALAARAKTEGATMFGFTGTLSNQLVTVNVAPFVSAVQLVARWEAVSGTALVNTAGQDKTKCGLGTAWCEMCSSAAKAGSTHSGWSMNGLRLCW